MRWTTTISALLLTLLTGCLPEQENVQGAGALGTSSQTVETTSSSPPVGSAEVPGVSWRSIGPAIMLTIKPTIPGWRYNIGLSDNLTEPWDDSRNWFVATGWQTDLLWLGRTPAGFFRVQAMGSASADTSMFGGSVGWLHPSVLNSTVWVIADAPAWQTGKVKPIRMIYPDER